MTTYDETMRRAQDEEFEAANRGHAVLRYLLAGAFFSGATWLRSLVVSSAHHHGGTAILNATPEMPSPYKEAVLATFATLKANAREQYGGPEPRLAKAARIHADLDAILAPIPELPADRAIVYTADQPAHEARKVRTGKTFVEYKLDRTGELVKVGIGKHTTEWTLAFLPDRPVRPAPKGSTP